jgi:hypothetical protein
MEPAASMKSATAPAGLREPRAGREQQSQQYCDRPFHVSLLAETSDEEV